MQSPRAHRPGAMDRPNGQPCPNEAAAPTRSGGGTTKPARRGGDGRKKSHGTSPRAQPADADRGEPRCSVGSGSGAPPSNTAPANSIAVSVTGSRAASPRQVIRGESLTPPVTSNPRAALIDWLNFTFPFYFDGMRFIELSNRLGAAFGFAPGASRNKGHLGYSDSWELGNGYGILATGGQAQGNTCLVSLNGSGCAPVKDWQAVHALLRSVDARITRIDLAYDDFQGVYNIIAALEMQALGKFASQGRPPAAQYVTDFDSGQGKTLYVGSRDNGKLLRVYEKGKQLGDPLSPWVRWEVELHNKDRTIPPEVLLRPGDYLAGAYPCLAWVSETQDRIKTTRQQLKISFDHLVKYCRQSYGKLVYVMHEGLGYDPRDIVERLSVVGIPPRLDLPPVTAGDAEFE